MSRIFSRYGFFKREAFTHGIRKQTILTNSTCITTRYLFYSTKNSNIQIKNFVGVKLEYSILLKKKYQKILTKNICNFLNTDKDGLYRHASKSHKIKQIAAVIRPFVIFICPRVDIEHS